MKLLAAQLNLTIGDLKGNFAKIQKVIKEETYDVVVFSELALTGYPPNDLLLRKGFVETQLRYLDRVRKLTAHTDAVVVIGAVTKNEGVGKPLFNSALAFQNGQEIFRYHKQLLPTYNIFDENRYFQAGAPDQNQIVSANRENGTVIKFGVVICEDAWNDEAITNVQLYSTNPVKAVGESDVELIITLNASPSHIGKHFERYEMYKTLSKRYNKAILYVNQVGGNDALIFDGYSFLVVPTSITNSTETLFPMKGFEEEIRSYSLNNPHFQFSYPRIAANPNEQIFEHLKLGIKDYVQKNGFKTVVVGSSGGIDSAVVIALAASALGAENVKAITMPSKVSSLGSIADSILLCDALGVELFTRPIKDEVDISIANFTKAFGVAPSRLTIENEQARIRGRILMEYSNHFGSLVLSTGNKSEMSVGYCTIYGDMCGGLAVIADAYKMEVFSLARWYNDFHGKSLIPEAILDKPPSAELWEGQQDTDSLPPYPVLDAVLHLYLERDLLSEEEIENYTRECEKLTLADIKKLLQMTDRAEFKRQQAPPVLRIHRRAFGFGRNLPITQKFEVNYENVL